MDSSPEIKSEKTKRKYLFIAALLCLVALLGSGYILYRKTLPKTKITPGNIYKPTPPTTSNYMLTLPLSIDKYSQEESLFNKVKACFDKKCLSNNDIKDMYKASEVVKIAVTSIIWECLIIKTAPEEKKEYRVETKGIEKFIKMADACVSSTDSSLFDNLAKIAVPWILLPEVTANTKKVLDKLFTSNYTNPYNTFTTANKKIKIDANMTTLDFDDIGLTTFPLLTGVNIDKLKKLRLGSGFITEIPSDNAFLGRFKSLKVLDLSNNNIESFPSAVYGLSKLQKLHLEHNPVANNGTVVDNSKKSPNLVITGLP